MTPFISTIIPTIGRPSLEKAVRSVLDQETGGFDSEIVVVNDSGRLFDERSWMVSPRIRLINTNRRRATIARNAGAAIARGAYLHFLDDDDWIEPGALAEFHRLTVENPVAVVVYGGCRMADETDRDLGIMNLGITGNCASPLMGASLIQFGSAAIKTDAFFRVGGINPTFQISEETDLFRRLAMIGDFANSGKVVATLLRGNGWQTSLNYDLAVENLMVSRETILNLVHAYTRLRKSATKPYWRGRNLKLYLASAKWNLRQQKYPDFISRIIFSILIIISNLRWVLNKEFVVALRDWQVPCTIDRVLEGGQRN